MFDRLALTPPGADSFTVRPPEAHLLDTPQDYSFPQSGIVFENQLPQQPPEQFPVPLATVPGIVE